MMRYVFVALTALCLSGCGLFMLKDAEVTEVPASSAEVETQLSDEADDFREVAEIGEACGGIAGIGCEPGLYCHFEPGVCTSVYDAMGECRTRPQVCTREYRPVIGCDGETYPNACEAYAGGTSVSEMARP